MKNMSDGKKITGFILRLKEKYMLPEEKRLEVSRKNLAVLLFFSSILFLFGAVMLIILSLKHESFSSRYIYYIGMCILTSISMLFCIILRKYGSYIGNQTFVVIFLTFLFCLLMYSFLNSPDFLTGLISLFIGNLIIIICFEIIPIFHIFQMIAFLYVLEMPRKGFQIPVNMAVNCIIFAVCIVILSLFRRAASVQKARQRLQIEKQNRQLEVSNIELERQTDSLLVNRNALEEYVHSQKDEIRLQNERLIRVQNNTIVSLANLVENRDEDTGGHVLRTRDYVGLIAMKAYLMNLYPELDEKMIRLFVKAAPMHDIGKIAVPDAVLKKPGRLTPEEFEQIKLHTVKGGEIVESVLGAAEDEEYVRVTKEIATSHHEKYDGTGYPYGLAGEDIPLGARMMAVADVFDALVSPRCYKAPMTEEEAFSIIMESAGTHFDPQLARLFIDARDEVLEISQRLYAC